MAQTALLVKDGKVLNLILIDDPSDLILGEGVTLHIYDGVWEKGWPWDGEKCVDPNPPPEPIAPKFDG